MNYHFSVSGILPHSVVSKPFDLYRPEGERVYLLLYIKSSGYAVINGKSYDFHPFDFMLLKPNTPHEIHASDDKFIHDWIHFSVDDPESFNRLPIRFDTLFSLSDFDTLSSIVRLVYQEYISHRKNREEGIDSLMNYLMIHLMEQSNSANNLTKQETAMRGEFDVMRNALYTKFEFPSIEDMAKNVYLSVSRFSHLYKSFYNVSPLQDINFAKIQYAKQLLQTNKYSITQISAMCGFQNVYHFIRYFKQKEGTTPGKWR